MKRWDLLVWWLVANIGFAGCALGKSGKGEPGYFSVNLPGGLEGKTKKEVVQRLGLPEHTAKEGDLEYWEYAQKGAWYASIPIPVVGGSVGTTQVKALKVTFKADKVSGCVLNEKAFSLGVYTLQGAVAR